MRGEIPGALDVDPVIAAVPYVLDQNVCTRWRGDIIPRIHRDCMRSAKRK
jgi:hypothetical protein